MGILPGFLAGISCGLAQSACQSWGYNTVKNQGRVNLRGDDLWDPPEIWAGEKEGCCWCCAAAVRDETGDCFWGNTEHSCTF